MSMKQIQNILWLLALAATPAVAADTSILQRNQAFSQADVSISVGDTVKWGNADPFNHNISIRGGGVDTSLGIQKPDQVLSYKFDEAGAFTIICKIHPRMKMSVHVQ